MKKKEKGQPGYIKWRKEKYLIGTIAEFAVVIALVVLGYVQTKTKLKTDEVTCARYLKDMLNANHHEKMTVKIFHDYKAFLSRVEGMNNIVEVGHTENGREDRAVRKLILSTCM